MKVLFLAVATLATACFTLPLEVEAASKSRSVRAKAVKSAKAGPVRSVRVAQRPASVDANGLCQRDTGTPTSALNFRNRCDVEEFWRRTTEPSSAGDD